ncbi:glycoside hydrolase family 99-like domain-containing protein [Paraburkholderia sp. BR10923]|uniref:glycoside hydrolase family 99-like domain-containing protein n=1 Tax=Paraburkholderia sp. BR10923 TaxID=3236992 RepID=UPI0034D01A58
MTKENIAEVAYVAGFYDREHDGVRHFRWIAKSGEIVLPDIAHGRTSSTYIASVELGSPIDNKVRIISNGTTIIDAQISPGWKTFRFLIERPQAGEVKVRVEAESSFIEGGRNLGLMVGELEIESAEKKSRFYVNRPRPPESKKKDKPYLSAYYYLWYFTPNGKRSRTALSGKWAEGYARALLEPPQYPTLGEYVMNDPEVIETHIDWAADHGIDCFICNWEGMVGHRKFLSENLVHILQGGLSNGTLSGGKIPFTSKDSTGNGWDSVSQGWDKTGYPIYNLNRIYFSVLIESRLIVKQWPPRANSEECIRAFTDAVIYMAENFFGSPRWQRIDGRPVIYIYEVFSWKGGLSDFYEFRASVDEAVRSIVDPVTGKRYTGLYIVGDALYPYEQDLDRLQIFDAITGYQPYPPSSSSAVHEGRNGWEFRGQGLFTCSAFEEYHRKFYTWAKEKSINLIPTVIPKYNDRAVRGALDHYAYPPISRSPYDNISDARACVLFKKNIEAQLRWVTPDSPMLNINSWNEWFEDTSIEPVGYTTETGLPDYLNQGENIGTSTNLGLDRRVPAKVVTYGNDGHTWIDTPDDIREKGVDITQGFEWPAYGFDYLYALRDFFGLTYGR